MKKKTKKPAKPKDRFWRELYEFLVGVYGDELRPAKMVRNLLFALMTLLRDRKLNFRYEIFINSDYDEVGIEIHTERGHSDALLHYHDLSTEKKAVAFLKKLYLSALNGDRRRIHRI